MSKGRRKKSSADQSSISSRSVFNTVPFEEEEPISDAYPEIDNDLARDNLENDLTAADLQDM